jgi:hypothetical protein
VGATASIFFDVKLPNPATWFYFSALLAAALFVKFSRLLSMRNWDVLTLFLFAPGFLLLWEAKTSNPPQPVEAYWAYVWLLGASAYFLLRCLIDLALVRRPAISPNLTVSGLACLAGALFAGLTWVSCQPPRKDAATAPPDANPKNSDGGEKAHEAPAAAPIDGLLSAALPRVEEAADVPVSRLAAVRALALLCHLLVVAGLVLVGWRCFEDLHAGVAAAAFYLLLPYTYLLTPFTELGVGRWDDLWPMAWMVWAVFAYRRPVLAGVFLGVAVGGAVLPAVTLPVWLSFYWRRGAGRFAAAFLLTAGLVLALCVGGAWAAGVGPPADALARWTHWQATPAGDEVRGVWQGVYWVYRLPVFIAYAAFLITTFFWPAPKNLAHVLALSAAALLGAQFWCGEYGGAFVLWYLPLALLLVFRPNLTAARPPPPAHDWLSRLGRRLGLRVSRLFRRRQPARVS